MGKKDKKKGEEKSDSYLGRPGNRVKMGILGLPNVGKSTLFNVLSRQQVPAENYPFCTIEPAKAQVEIEDKRLDLLCEVYKPKKKINACLICWDIAGLVAGAHEGKGLGNEFLSNIAAVDALYHVIRAFSAKKVTHVDGDVNPIRDLETIKNELVRKDIQIMDKVIEKRGKLALRSTDKVIKDEYNICLKVRELLGDGKEVRLETWSGKEIDLLNTLNLFTAKNIVYLVNVSEKNWIQQANKWIEPIKAWVEENAPGSPVVPFSAKFESKLLDVEEEKGSSAKKKYCKEVGAKSAVKKIVAAGYDSLRLMNYFTAGEPEVRAWAIRKGWKAPQAAGVIHGDFEKGFICAETMAFADFKKLGSEAACKAAGKYKQNGREYVVQDGDIMLFKGNGF